MRKFFSFILAIFMLVPCAIMLTACGEHKHTYSQEWTTNQTHHWQKATCEHTEEKTSYGEHDYTDENDATCNTCSYERELANEPTAQELSATYKNIAISLWDSIGVDDPTVPQTQAVLMSVSFPNITDETSDAGKISNIKMNANTSAGLFYMISLLYQNPNFVLTNDVAHFDATCTITTPQESITNDYTFKMSTILDKENNKVILELTSFVSGMTQYSYMEINYNFENNTLLSYKFYSMIVELNTIVGMSLTEEDKYLYNEPNSLTDPFAVAIIECKDAFVAKTENVQKLTGSFNSEMQAYFDVLNKCLAELQ
ncbi:MAG: hypothetical protein J6Q51_00610 [Clostridia bacterium]|nr:hypothetical protein [Clostridia bacterium]